MPGLFIERHGISVSTYFRVSVLYIHQDEMISNGKAEIIESSDEMLNVVKIYYPKSKTGIGVLDKLLNICNFHKYHRKGINLISKRHGKPNLIHVHVLTRHGIIALLQKWRQGIPYVITEHWTRYLPLTNSYRGFLRKIATRMVAANASAIMPVSENLRDAMIDCGIKNRNYIVIPNVVDMKMFRIQKKEKDRMIKRIIHVSCFDDRQKNISGILRVLKRMLEERDDFACDMVGDGIDYQNLLEYASELKLPKERVVFYGLKENAELAGLMAQADFMVMFSNYENLPVVILESYACGVPVLSSDVGGIKEHLNTDLGILIRARDEEALYREMNYMLNNLEKYDPDKLRKYAINHFSNEVIGDHLRRVYESAIK